MLTVEEATTRILAGLTTLNAEETDLLSAQGRICAEEVTATRALPPFDNSAMDGYAVRAADCTETPATLQLSGIIPAGQVATAGLQPGTAMRIFTGAPVPEGADAVVIQENTTASATEVTIQSPAKSGDHIRRAGEDIAREEPYLRTGKSIAAGEIGMLAAQGRTWVRTVRPPRVAILPTGDELVPIDQPLGPGQIRNSNSFMLAAQVAAAGAIPVRLAPAADTPEAVATALAEAANASDLILTCGGVSVGDFDHVGAVVEQGGELQFWKVAIKPGKPLAFGHFGGRPILGLPGNPVSAFVTFVLFGRPALAKLAGNPDWRPQQRTSTLSCDAHPARGRRSFLRGRFVDQGARVEPAAQQGSGQLSSLLGAECLIDLPPGDEPVAAGTAVNVIELGGG